MLRTFVTLAVWLLPSVLLAAELASETTGRSGPPREAIKSALEWVSTGIEVAGVGIILVGAIAATLIFLYSGPLTVGWPAAYHRYRANLGQGILLGLELLVAADIIGTVAVTPSVENLLILGLIVLIRTFLSFSLTVEIEGRWPWQRAAAEGSTSGQQNSERP
jgi:uncharacterized membrane protein